MGRGQVVSVRYDWSVEELLRLEEVDRCGVEFHLEVWDWLERVRHGVEFHLEVWDWLEGDPRIIAPPHRCRKKLGLG